MVDSIRRIERAKRASAREKCRTIRYGRGRSAPKHHSAFRLKEVSAKKKGGESEVIQIFSRSKVADSKTHTARKKKEVLTQMRDIFVARMQTVLGIEIEVDLISADTALPLYSLARAELQRGLSKPGRRFGIDYQKVDALRKSIRKLSEIICFQYPAEMGFPKLDLAEDSFGYEPIVFEFISGVSAKNWLTDAGADLGIQNIKIYSYNCEDYAALIHAAFCKRYSIDARNIEGHNTFLCMYRDWSSSLKNAVAMILKAEKSA